MRNVSNALREHETANLLAVMDVFLLSGMAGAIHYLSEIADPEASCFPAFEL